MFATFTLLFSTLFMPLLFGAETNPPLVTITYLNGDHYTGEVKNGIPHGHGTMEYAHGRHYTGMWIDKIYHGPGTLTFSNGDQYSGNFVDGNLSGQGSVLYKEGHRFEGELLNFSKHGQGVMTYTFGERYFGRWAHDQKIGYGTILFPDGTWLRGNIHNGMIIGDNTLIGELKFKTLLTGMCASGGYATYTLGIISAFLKQSPLTSHLALPLQEALEILLDTSIGRHQKLYRQILLLKVEESRLLAYGFSGHAMGLSLMRSDPSFFMFTIYNSGDGLFSYHPRKVIGNRKKYQTALQVKVPQASITAEVVEKILNFENIKSAQEAYEHITNLSGAKIIPIPKEKEVWQTLQKGSSCSFKWIMVYFKNILPPSLYLNLEATLFSAALEGPKYSPPDPIAAATHQISLDKGGKVSVAEAEAILNNELIRKIEKRFSKLR